MFLLSLVLRIAGVICVIHGILILLHVHIPEIIPGGWIVNILIGIVLFGIGVFLFLSNKKARVK
jgi:hypothetical protein